MSRGRSDIEYQVVFSEANLREVEEISTKEVSMNVGAAEANLKVE